MQRLSVKYGLVGTLTLLMLTAVLLPSFAGQAFYPWKMENDAINAPLGGFKGEARRGRDIVKNKDKGNCLACHSLPISEEPFHGTVGPPLQGVASRLNEGQIRLRVADEQKLIPATIMPGFYKNPRENNLCRP